MSILIKGMEMPKNCYTCPFCDYVSARCDAVKGTPYTPADRYEKRADWCPLIEIPPHGRLIDADELMRDGWKLHKEVTRVGGYSIHEKPLNYPDVPTVIEAERGET